jgi:putative nucleotidyltransferase with HDIG domain
VPRNLRLYLLIYLALIAFLLINGASILFPSLSFYLTPADRAYLAGVGTLRAVGDEAFPPFSFRSPYGQTGYEKELVDELARVLGIEIEHVQMPWSEARNALDEGRVDFVTGMAILPERQLQYQFSEPMLASYYVFIFPAALGIEDPEELRSLGPVAAQLNSATHEIAVRLGFTVRTYDSPEACYQALQSQEVVAWVENQWVARYVVGSWDGALWRMVLADSEAKPYALAFAQGVDPRLVALFNRGLSRLQCEGGMEVLASHWFNPGVGSQQESSSQRRNLIMLLFAVILSGGMVLAYNAQLQKQVRSKTSELTRANVQLSLQQEKLAHQLVSTAQALGEAVDVKDKYTGGHSRRVATVAEAIARNMGLDAEQCFDIYLGALIHDIGKVGVPDAILNKIEPLTPEEMAEIRRHPEIGARILRAVEGLQAPADVVLYHHERWDGDRQAIFPAYPGQKAGADVPLAARIVSVADAFDAMTLDRPYRKARSISEALDIIKACSGTQFDPEVVEALVRTVKLGNPPEGETTA